MWKKLFLTLALTLGLATAASAMETSVTMRSLVAVPQGVELSYHVANASDQAGQALTLAALYDEGGVMLELKAQSLELAAGGWRDGRVLFAPQENAASAKVFVVGSWDGLRPLGPAGSIDLSEETLVNSWAELCDWVGSAPRGTVFRLRGGTIPCDSELKLKATRPLTIRGSDEETTILDFSGWSDALLNTPDEVKYTGVNITGSNVTLENVIVQGAPGVGVRMRGSASGYNLAQNVVTRYNHNSGFYLSDSAHHCTLRQCDSYRNLDIYKKGQDADGYSVSLNLGAHVLMDNCRAFENADDAYDNFNNHNDVTYLDCYAWNNGGIDCYTGRQDVDRGLAVDRNLGLVRLMCKESPEFAAALDQGCFELPLGMTVVVRNASKTGSEEVTLEQYITTVWEGNGNGFKLGSGDSSHGPVVGPEGFRRLERCISFDNYAKGFDRNNGKFTTWVTDFLSFGNYNRNYWSDQLTVQRAQNALSYLEGKSANGTDGSFPIIDLDKIRGEAMTQAVYQQSARLEEMLRADKIPGRFIIDPGWS